MMILAESAPAAGLELTLDQHVALAYAVVIVLLWGYAAWVCLASRKRRQRAAASDAGRILSEPRP